MKLSVQSYKDLCEGLIPQEDYFAGQLQEISEKFHGHVLTKLTKQLKMEKEDMEKKN